MRRRSTSPLIIDPPYGYQDVNVDGAGAHADVAAALDARLIGVRQKHTRRSAAARWSCSIPRTVRVLVFLRRYEDETILCVNNLSRFVQPVEIDLQRCIGARAGGNDRQHSASRPIGEQAVLPHARAAQLLLVPARGAGGARTRVTSRPAAPPLPVLLCRDGLAHALSLACLQALDGEPLLRFLSARRWFGEKGRAARGARVSGLIPIPALLPGDDSPRRSRSSTWISAARVRCAICFRSRRATER